MVRKETVSELMTQILMLRIIGDSRTKKGPHVRVYRFRKNRPNNLEKFLFITNIRTFL